MLLYIFEYFISPDLANICVDSVLDDAHYVLDCLLIREICLYLLSYDDLHRGIVHTDTGSIPYVSVHLCHEFVGIDCRIKYLKLLYILDRPYCGDSLESIIRPLGK